MKQEQRRIHKGTKRFSQRIRTGMLVWAAGSLFGCIHNDIPYPVVKAEITAFEAGHQIACRIDPDKCTVSLELDEAADLAAVNVLRFEVSNDAAVTPEISAEIDLREPLVYTLTTYQDYLWTISAVQQIEQYVRVENQIGEALFDYDSRMVLVTVSSAQDLAEVTVLGMKLGPEGAEIVPDPATVHDFRTIQKFSVVYNGTAEIWNIRVVKSSKGVVTGAANARAKSAVLSGSGQADAGEYGFEYKESGAEGWTRVSGTGGTGGNFTAAISGLVPETEYVYRAVSGTLAGDERSFTTEQAAQIPNSGFDDWFKEGKSWFPDRSLDAADYWWDSGNKGANSIGEKNPTMPEESLLAPGASGTGKRAARLASTDVVGVFAAGSIYTGQFLERVGFGARLSFGRPFSSRPTGLKGYYNYSSGTINKVKAPYEHLSGVKDSCHIYALLTDWNAPFEVNTNTKKFVKFTDEAIIAMCELKTDRNTGGYEPFDLKFEYRDENRIPKYILIVASASKYGDYFTGCTSSVLYVDEFELTY